MADTLTLPGYRQRRLRLMVLLASLLLAACASAPQRHPAVVEEGLNEPVDVPAYHIVQAGDTVYSLSLRYDRDYRELARINHLGSDYRILVGQKLYLKSHAGADAAALAAPAAGASVQVGGAPPAAPLLTKPLAATAVTARTHVPDKKAPVARPAPGNTVAPPAEPAASGATAAASVSQNAPPVGAPVQHATESTNEDADISWAWPATGSIISNFSTNGVGNKGLDIAGRRGDAVLAAADGVVVYAGSGLVGYGKLIIIRHNNNYLSAYAHNDRFEVTEGQSVKRGDRIAELGSSGADRDELHFEIRRQGKPVNPLRYLPPR